MKKSELLSHLAVLHPKETVFLKFDGRLFSISSIEVEGAEEPPVHAFVLIEDGAEEFARVQQDRADARAVEEERLRLQAEEASKAEDERIAREEAAKAEVNALVEAKVREILGAGGAAAKDSAEVQRKAAGK